MMFGIIEDAIKNAKAIESFDGLSFVLRLPKNKETIPELIQEQLWGGISGTGDELRSIGGSYSGYTIKSKKRRGLPTNRVTLFETGEFYQSIIVNIDSDGYTVEFDPIKGGDDLRDRWGNEIVDLTDESIVELIEKITEDYVKWLIEELTK